MRIETASAARFISVGGADHHALAALYQPLRISRRAAASYADGPRLGYVFGDGQQQRHRLERASEVIYIQTGDDHSLALIGQNVRHSDQVVVEELPFVNAHDVSVDLDRGQNLVGRFDRLRRDLHLRVRNDVLIRIAQIDRWLEYLNLLSRDLRPSETANQFLALAAEHRPGDDLDPARIARMTFQFFNSFLHFVLKLASGSPSTPKRGGRARNQSRPGVEER